MLTEADLKPVYATGEDEPFEFFLEALMNSQSLDFGLGYFSSSGFRALSAGFAFFISKNGRMRMIINEYLSLEDKEIIEKGLRSNPDDLIEEKIIKNIVELEKTLSSYDRHFFNCISWLISAKRLELIAISPKHNDVGIAHQKFGLFTDIRENKVAFSGSANFSSNALFHNLESISCYKSWLGEKTESERLSYYENLFEKIWNGKSPVVKVIPIEKVKTVIQTKFPLIDLNDLLLEEERLMNETLRDNILPTSLVHKIEELKRKMFPRQNTPHFPTNSTPREYQIEAYENWKQSNYVGFFEMATGTGKTITSLNCALELYKQEKELQLLILVPTLPLADQWKEEVESFNISNVILANSRNPGWAENILRQINKSLSEKINFCIVTTYATFNIDKFQAIINRLKDSTLLIADEAHNFGTKRSQEKYPHKFKRRIGLSVTPERHYDESGTRALLEFFNSYEKPTFSLNMQEAIEKGFLCKYYYYPKTIELTDDELKEYKGISKRLLKYFDAKTGSFSDDPIVNTLLQRRKRIINKAENKLDTLRECLTDALQIRNPLKYTLVYVPEGRPENFDAEDQRLINEYAEVIAVEFKLSQHQFIGITENRSEILRQFGSGSIDVLTAMKCLDEGVDVKRTEVAIFCASSSNPRQFVQRRGRILRTHPDKRYAYIFDMIVVPDVNPRHFDENLTMERGILRGELKRVYEFASMSVNKYQALKSLEEIAERYNIDIFSTEIS